MNEEMIGWSDAFFNSEETEGIEGVFDVNEVTKAAQEYLFGRSNLPEFVTKEWLVQDFMKRI